MTKTAAPIARRWSADTRRVFLAQGFRAFAYGLGAVLLGTTLDQLGLSAAEAGLVLAAVVAGAVTASFMIGRWPGRVHQAVDYRPITRYEIAGGYLNLTALGAGPDTFPTEEKP